MARHLPPALLSLSTATPTIDPRLWDPERFAGAGCQLPRLTSQELSVEAFFDDLVVGAKPAVIQGEPGCVAAASAVAEWDDAALAQRAGRRLVVAMASSSRNSSFFPTPMHPAWRHALVFREPLEGFLARYAAEPRGENWYTYSNLVPELRTLLPRPSFDWHLRTVVNARGGELSNGWDGRLWLGLSDGWQESPLHRDGHENLHCMVQGRKLFALVQPAALLVPEHLHFSPLHLHTRRGRHVPAARCVLEPGEWLFLPALWWHSVVALRGRNVGINFWYKWRARPGRVRLVATIGKLRTAFARVPNGSAAALARRKLTRRGQVAELQRVEPGCTCSLRFSDGATLDFPLEAVAEQLE